MSYCIIFGTRPEYLKLKPIIDEFKIRSIYCDVIYIQQHTQIDEELDYVYKTLTIEDSTTNDRLCTIGQQILKKLPKYIEDSTHIIVQGDTASAYYSALTAFQMQKTVIHIEAGLRTYDLDKPFPEEAYRQMISRIASIHFTPHNDSSQVLLNEKVSGKIYNVGNTILDLIKSYNLECTMSNTVLITFHRRENWGKIDILLTGLKKLVQKTPHIKYIWYLHHNPSLQQKVKEAIKDIPSIELQSPRDHKEFTKQIARSNFLISDSGGIQEEASFLGKHCIVLRASTERNHIPGDYITVLEDYSKVDEIYETVPIEHLPQCNVYGYGDSAKQIVDVLFV
uniref:UDP-N-acetylglucosamine 2-epimerase domain-containing protein n=1 Tax=viral metagenome TaxID=1070528 RepID=A0A6C0EPV0_9ZZZZ